MWMKQLICFFWIQKLFNLTSKHWTETWKHTYGETWTSGECKRRKIKDSVFETGTTGRRGGSKVSGRGGGGHWSSWWGWSPGSGSLRKQDTNQTFSGLFSLTWEQTKWDQVHLRMWSYMCFVCRLCCENGQINTEHCSFPLKARTHVNTNKLIQRLFQPD